MNDRNTIMRYRMRPENIYGDPDREFPVMDTFNILMINVGTYSDDLPDASALPAALFSVMEDVHRQELVKNKFNITLDDVILDGVRKMGGFGQNTWDAGYYCGRMDGNEDGMIKIIAAQVKDGADLESLLKYVESESQRESIRKRIQEM